ncbi:MAG: glycosyltransferase family 39 protein [Lentisphaerae bacterium]|nr:glycosyltransferase family 39 protein [Lentisphaerota bacterium]
MNGVFIGIGLYWIFLIPYNNAPDENTHFKYSVEFILKHHRLPVWGVDDLDQFRHSLSSYNHLPALNYLVAAGMAGAAQACCGIEPYLGARIASLAWGMLFLTFLYLALWSLTGRTALATIVTAAFAFIPQVLFNCSYINADAHSLAIAALLAWALIRFWKKQSDLNLIILGLSGGLLFSAKYNYFYYVPFIAAGLGYLAWRRVATWRDVGRIVLAVICGSILISGFWYCRNTWLYGAPVPFLLSEQHLANLGIVREAIPINRGISLASLTWLIQQKFVPITFASFFGLFGYLDVGFPPEIYTALFVIIMALVILFLIELLITRDRAVAVAGLWLAAFMLTILALHVGTSLTIDPQPQGRYHFVSLVPMAVFLGWAAHRQRRLRKYALALMVVTGALLVQTVALFAKTYGGPMVFTVLWDGPRVHSAITTAAKPAEKNYIRVACAVNDSEELTALRVDFPKNILARYRDFRVILDSPRGRQTWREKSLPPPQYTDLRYDPTLNAFDTIGSNPSAAFTLPATLGPLKAITLEMAIEHRRLRDPKF